MAGNLLISSSTKSSTIRAGNVIKFFHVYPAQLGRLQRVMEEDKGKKYAVIDQSDTRWYYHYRIVLSLFKALQYLEKYKASILNSYPSLKKSACAEDLDTAGSTRFWLRLELILDILRVLIIEIGVTEESVANTSDFIQSFGSVWAFLKRKNEPETNIFSALPRFLEDLLSRMIWSLNIY